MSSQIEVSEGVVIGSVTALSYLSAYYYKKSFFSYFIIPELFVEVNLEDCLYAAGHLFFVSLSIFNIFTNTELLFHKSTNDSSSTLSKIMNILAFIFLVGFALDNFFGFGWKVYAFLLLMWGGAMIAVWSGMWKPTSRKISNNETNSLSKPQSTLVHKIGLKVMLLVIFAIFYIMTATVLGIKQAVKTTSFRFIDNTNLAIIGEYNDAYVCKEFDDFSNKFLSPVYLVKVGDVGYLKLNLRNVNDWSIDRSPHVRSLNSTESTSNKDISLPPAALPPAALPPAALPPAALPPAALPPAALPPAALPPATLPPATLRLETAPSVLR